MIYSFRIGSLSIEIKSLDERLRNYAKAYLECYDLRDEKVGDIYLDQTKDWFLCIHNRDENRSYWYLYMKDHIFEGWKIVSIPTRKNNITKFEAPNLLELTKEGLGIKTGEGNVLKGPFNITNLSVTVENPITPIPIYGDHGMYYIYETELSKFDKNLSKDLYYFYTILLIAESERAYIQNYLDSHPDGKLTGQYFDAYMDMRIKIIYCTGMAPNILKKLEREELS